MQHKWKFLKIICDSLLFPRFTELMLDPFPSIHRTNFTLSSLFVWSSVSPDFLIFADRVDIQHCFQKRCFCHIRCSHILHLALSRSEFFKVVRARWFLKSLFKTDVGESPMTTDVLSIFYQHESWTMIHGLSCHSPWSETVSVTMMTFKTLSLFEPVQFLQAK